jgi:hypothetical protein
LIIRKVGLFGKRVYLEVAMRQMFLRCSTVVALVGVLTATLIWSQRQRTAKAMEDSADPAVARARALVRMLDDLYKTAVVLINDTYVDDRDTTSAGEVARSLFDVMRSKGWHDARLIDATGKPLNGSNKPNGEFETSAIKRILAGSAYYDAVVEEEGKLYLRAATVVPVVNDRCVMCHPGNKIGDVLGAVSYKLKIE